MIKHYLFLLISFSVLSGFLRAAYLPEGNLLSKVEGTATRDPQSGIWRFSVSGEAKVGNRIVPAGALFTLLPSRELEKIISYTNGSDKTSVQLTAITTQYKGINYLFPTVSIPLQKPVTENSSASPDQPEQQLREFQTASFHANTDPNEAMVLPEEILEKLKSGRRTDFTKIKQVSAGIEDRVAVKRSGYFDHVKDMWIFRPEGFGQNVSKDRYIVLPCQKMEETQAELKTALGRQRYEVSGILTDFNGVTFLLIQRSQRTYTQGNFTR